MRKEKQKYNSEFGIRNAEFGIAFPLFRETETKMNKILKSIIAAGMAFLLLSGCGVCALAAEASDLSDADGGIVGIAHRGDWTNAPENSLPALLAAAEDGLAYVLADVSVTKDGVPVLLESASAKRMLGADKENTAELTFAEITALSLKNRMGGKGSKATGSVPMPGPTSKTTSSSASSAKSTILPTTWSFIRKFCPRRCLVASP